MTGEEPLAVVALPEGEQGLAEIFDGRELLDPELDFGHLRGIGERGGHALPARARDF
jgi:hypothetical protein